MIVVIPEDIATALLVPMELCPVYTYFFDQITRERFNKGMYHFHIN